VASCLFLYSVVPAAAVRVRNAWPATVIMAVLHVLLQNLFSVYVGNFAHYNAIYGSLGTAIAFTFFVYLAAEVVLLGAEIASEWPRVRHELKRDGDPRHGTSRRQRSGRLMTVHVLTLAEGL
jgi:uncharacterized BrkB/YihY/UPF0761 family membrane protein